MELQVDPQGVLGPKADMGNQVPLQPNHRRTPSSIVSSRPFLTLHNSLIRIYGKTYGQYRCYLHTIPFPHRTPQLFYHYHSLLELQMHQLCRLSPYLQSIHFNLPECIIYIHYLLYPESLISYFIQNP